MIDSSEIEEIITSCWDMPDDLATETLLELISDLKLLCDQGLGNDQVWFYIGYSWYFVPVEHQQRFENVQKYLSRALSANSSNCFAAMYLAHLYFDVKDFHGSRKYLNRIPAECFKNKLQAWRAIKAKEMMVCCSLYLDLSSLGEELKEWVTFCSVADSEDCPMPTEFMDALVCKVQDDRKLVDQLIPTMEKVLSITDSYDIYAGHIKQIKQTITGGAG